MYCRGSSPYNGFVQPYPTRRRFVQATVFAPMLNLRATRSTDAAITDLTYDFEEFGYRTPYKFGGVEVDRVTLLNVHCTVRNRGGQTARG